MKIFEEYEGDFFFTTAYDFLSISFAIAAIYSVVGLFNGITFQAVSAIFFLQLMMAFLIQHKTFKKSSLALIFSWFSFVSISLPLCFLMALGTDYVFGLSISKTPYSQDIYFQNIHYSIMFLALFWFCAWLAILFNPVKQKEIPKQNNSTVLFPIILAFGLATLWFTYADNIQIMNSLITNSQKHESLLRYLFFDHAFLVFSGVTLLFCLNQKDLLTKIKKIIIKLAILSWTMFLLLSFFSGSKGALLVVSVLFFLYPLSEFRIYKESKIIFFSPKFTFMTLVTAPLLFYAASVQRATLGNGVAPNLETLIAGIYSVDFINLKNTFIRIFYRLSQSGFDQFVLLSNSFINEGFSSKTAIAFAEYIVKNTINLLVLGTPFPEAYAPSSQMFEQVLNRAEILWFGDSNVVNLLKSFNTQPYTLFGVFLVFFGWLSPLMFFFFVYCLAFIYKKSNLIILRLLMLYFFGGILNSYGVDATVGNSFNFFISICFLSSLEILLTNLILKSSARRLFTPKGQISN